MQQDRKTGRDAAVENQMHRGGIADEHGREPGAPSRVGTGSPGPQAPRLRDVEAEASDDGRTAERRPSPGGAAG